MATADSMIHTRHFEVRCPAGDVANSKGNTCTSSDSRFEIAAHTIAKMEIGNDFDIICLCNPWFSFPTFRTKVVQMDNPNLASTRENLLSLKTKGKLPDSLIKEKD